MQFLFSRKPACSPRNWYSILSRTVPSIIIANIFYMLLSRVILLQLLQSCMQTLFGNFTIMPFFQLGGSLSSSQAGVIWSYRSLTVVLMSTCRIVAGIQSSPAVLFLLSCLMIRCISFRLGGLHAIFILFSAAWPLSFVDVSVHHCSLIVRHYDQQPLGYCYISDWSGSQSLMQFSHVILTSCFFCYAFQPFQEPSFSFSYLFLYPICQLLVLFSKRFCVTAYKLQFEVPSLKNQVPGVV